MRRDKTWKVCANHYIEPWMLLKPFNSDRTWMWLVHSDFAGEWCLRLVQMGCVKHIGLVHFSRRRKLQPDRNDLIYCVLCSELRKSEWGFTHVAVTSDRRFKAAFAHVVDTSICCFRVGFTLVCFTQYASSFYHIWSMFCVPEMHQLTS